MCDKQKAELEAALRDAEKRDDQREISELQLKLKALAKQQETDAVIVAMLASM